MPLFRPNTVVLQPVFYMFTRCMLCMEKSIETMEKSIEIMEISMKTMENRWSLWVNQWTPWKNRLKPWKNRWTVQMAHFSSKTQQSTSFCSKTEQIARKSAPDWKTKQIYKTKTKNCTPSKLWLPWWILCHMSQPYTFLCMYLFVIPSWRCVCVYT